MRRVGRTVLLVLAFLAAWPGSASAGEVEPGSVAPAGCWTMDGGCAARTGATATEGLQGPLAPAWSVELGKPGHVIDLEPRVWGDRIFVSVLQPGGTRALHVLSLGDGRPVAKPLTARSSWTLDFGVWGDRVLVRESPEVLAVHHLRGGAFHRVWRVEAKSQFFSPVLLDGAVFALDGSDVVCWDASQGTERWRKSGEYRGGLAVRGDGVFVLQTDDVGNLHLVRLGVAEGIQRGKVFVGTYRTRGAPRVGEISRISVHTGNAFVLHESELRSESGRGYFASRVLRSPYQIGPSGGIFAYRKLPAAAGPSHWLTVEARREKGVELKLAMSYDKDITRAHGWTLADKSRHPQLASSPLEITVAGKTAYFGACAVEWDSRRVKWMDEKLPLRFRPIPARSALLVVPAERRVTCLREPGAGTTGALFLGPAHAIGTETAPQPVRQSGVVLYVDDDAHAGDYLLEPAGKSVTIFRKRGKREKEIKRPMAEVALVLDEQDRVLYTSSFQNMGRILERWNFLRHADEYYKFAKAAYKTKDWRLMQELVTQASLRGVSEKKLKFPRKQIGSLRDRAARPDAERKQKLVAKIEALEAEEAARVANILRSPIQDPRWTIQKPFARQLLQLDPSDEVAVALIRERMPAYLPMPKPFVALDWIDFVDQVKHTEVTRIDPPIQGAKDLTRIQREYGSALVTWRKDLVALQSEDLLILTPLASPGRIAGCLAMGTLVCRALEDVFSAGANVRTDPWPLILRLYETKKEYLAASQRRGATAFQRKQMEWTGGHFDPGAGISRIFLPARPDAWKTVMSVYAHELTHHWIAERCPLYKASEQRRTAGQAGYWIVEGMATFIEEFRWDLEQQGWSTVNPAAHSLDAVANATPEQLHDWKYVYNLPALVFGQLKRFDKERKIPMRWRLGYKHQVSEAGMFYSQAAATCHYLFHAGEDLRKRLLDYVRLHYTGQMPRKTETIQHILGLSPEELGRRVVAHAKKLNAQR